MTAPRKLRCDWAGKLVVVAGGSSGINLGIARMFADEGAQLVLLSRSPERIAKAANEVGHGALGLTADVRDYVQVEAAFAEAGDRYGEVDVVVSGAAGNFLMGQGGGLSHERSRVVTSWRDRTDYSSECLQMARRPSGDGRLLRVGPGRRAGADRSDRGAAGR